MLSALASCLDDCCSLVDGFSEQGGRQAGAKQPKGRGATTRRQPAARLAAAVCGRRETASARRLAPRGAAGPAGGDPRRLAAARRLQRAPARGVCDAARGGARDPQGAGGEGRGQEGGAAGLDEPRALWGDHRRPQTRAAIPPASGAVRPAALAPCPEPGPDAPRRRAPAQSDGLAALPGGRALPPADYNNVTKAVRRTLKQARLTWGWGWRTPPGPPGRTRTFGRARARARAAPRRPPLVGTEGASKCVETNSLAPACSSAAAT
jgi:hypothetical protein